jgi:hypothetical protein
MEAVAHNPEFAKKSGVSQKVGKDFAAADDKAGITKTHSSPKSRDEHIARRTRHATQHQTAKEFGTSQSTVSRRTMKQGYTKGKI